MRVQLLLIALGLATMGLACKGPDVKTVVEEPLASPAQAETSTSPPVAPSSLAAMPSAAPLLVDPYLEEREAMVQNGIVGWGISEPSVIEVMRVVPRHEFVPDEYLSQAYENHPLPIGYGQTISQPYIVALMTVEADVGKGDHVLEIGTGSSYQAAVLAELVDHVFSIEIIGALAERAEATLRRLGYDNITVRHGDGYYGWEEEAPFDAILVTAAPDHVPQPLVAQLKIGARMIIPVGPVGGYQTLWKVTKVSEDEVRTENLGAVGFVPLTREER